MNRFKTLSRPFSAVLLLASAALLTSCFGLRSQGDLPLQSVLRFTDGEVLSWSRLPSPYTRDLIFEWSFKSPQERALWTVREGKLHPTPRGAMLRPTGGNHFMFRSTDLDTTRITSLEIQRGKMHGDAMTIRWLEDEEFFQPPRSMTTPLLGGSGDGTRTYTFNVAEHPEWTGRVRRFRIDPAKSGTEPSRFMSVRGFSQSLDGEKLAALLGRPGMEDFDGDARLALLAPPGYRLTRKAPQPLSNGARLRFAYGLQQSHGPDVTFTVETESDDGSTQVLWQSTLSPKDDGRRWHDAEVDLSSLAGLEPRLTLTTSGPDPEALLAGLPVWAHPEVSMPAAEALPPNVVLIIADTLRADRMSLYGHDRETTPNLAAWAERRGVVFENTVAAAPWTLPTHVSMFTGFNALRHGTNFEHPAADSLYLLAERLRDQGYRTTAFTGGGYLTPTFGLAQGFERFRHWRDKRNEGAKHHIGSDLGPNMERALQWLEDSPTGPFFLLFHTYEVHAPFRDHRPWYEEFAGTKEHPPQFLQAQKPASAENDWRINFTMDQRDKRGSPRVPIEADNQKILEAVYDSGIAKMDHEIAKLLERLRSTDLERDTLVVFTSDHGEGLGGEHEDIGHSYLADYNIMIPLIVSLPGDRSRPARIVDQVSQVDLLPSILEALGLPPGGSMDGRSLMPYTRDQSLDGPHVAESYAASTNYGFSLRVGDRWKLISEHTVMAPLAGTVDLFDLQADPRETQDLSTSDADKVERFSNEARRRLEEQSCHLRIEAANHSDQPLEIGLKGGVIRFKSWGPVCGSCASFADNRLGLRLPPGESLSLVVERSPGWQMKSEIRIADRPWTQLPPWQHQEIIDNGPVGVRLEADGSWNDGAGDFDPSASDTGFRIRWVDKGCPWLTGDTQEAVVIDEETRKQLEALGYITN